MFPSTALRKGPGLAILLALAALLAPAAAQARPEASMAEDGCANANVLPTRANGSPAVAVYRPGPAGELKPYALIVLEVAADRISVIHAFLDPSLFPSFGFSPTDQF